MPYRQLFVDWLDEELRKRGWSDYELARRAGISHSVLTRARQGTLPKWAACAAIAEALNMPFEMVFRHAGLISKQTTEDETNEELLYLYNQLAPRYKEEIIEFIRNRIEEQENFNRAIDELKKRSSEDNPNIRRLSDVFLGYSSPDDTDDTQG